MKNMLKSTFVYLVCVLFFTAVISHADDQVAINNESQFRLNSAKENINICSVLSREVIKEKYLNRNDVLLIEMVTWLSAQDSANNIYKFTSYVKLRKSDLTLYSWTFTTLSAFLEQNCKILSVKFEHETKLIEGDEYPESED